MPRLATQIQWQAKEILRQLANENPAWEILRFTNVEVSRRMVSLAGWASARENLIKISEAFYASDKNFETDFFDTVTHEAAHVVAWHAALRNGRRIRPHGPEWRETHLAMGGNGKRCHDLYVAEGFGGRRQAPVPVVRKLIQKGLDAR
jgi:predicted SprT family Zn-dependent metalloprotease